LQALEDAGYSRGRIARQHRGRLGVLAGITRSEFSLYGNAMLKMGKAPSTSFCSLVNRVSYVLDAQAPAAATVTGVAGPGSTGTTGFSTSPSWSVSNVESGTTVTCAATCVPADP